MTAFSALSKAPPVQLALGAAIVLGALYFLGRRAVGDVAAAVGNVNAGTPYAGTGPIGTLGNITNRVLFGAPQWLGERIGGGLADLRDVLGASSETRKGYTAAASASPVPPEARARINVH